MEKSLGKMWNIELGYLDLFEPNFALDKKMNNNFN